MPMRPSMPGVRVAFSTAPESQVSWQQQPERGERRTARRLASLLAGRGIVLIHDLRLGGSSSIDHIAVGPGGVTVIDSHAEQGAVDPGRLDGVQRQVEQVKRLAPEVEVRGAVCVPSADGLPSLRRREADGVVVEGPRRVARLARRGGSLSLKRRAQIAARLAVELPRGR
jgi:hypothetical protein